MHLVNFIWFVSSAPTSHPDRSCAFNLVLPVRSERHLRDNIDADTAMTNHVTATVKACLVVFRHIRSVRRSRHQHALLTIIRALVAGKVDYFNAVLTGVSGRLRSILKAARLVFAVRKSEPITPLLCELHWLRVPERIQFRLRNLVYRCLQGTAPPYLAESLHRTIEVIARCRVRSANTSLLLVPSTRRATLGNRAYAVAAPKLWNTLPIIIIIIMYANLYSAITLQKNYKGSLHENRHRL